jgi:uncharacterized damage-inducible protein DinB
MDAAILQVHLAYRDWQTKRLLAAAMELPAEVYEQPRGSSHGGIKGTLQHIYGADFVWFQRLHGISFTRADIVIPDALAELGEAWLKLLEEWGGWIMADPDRDWHEKITYTQFNGQQYSTPVWQVVLHMVNHGTLHAGQVVAMLRQAGIDPPQTDLIFFYRERDAQAAVP